MISGQTVLIVAAAIVFSALLFPVFDFTLTGKALQRDRDQPHRRAADGHPAGASGHHRLSRSAR